MACEYNVIDYHTCMYQYMIRMYVRSGFDLEVSNLECACS